VLPHLARLEFLLAKQRVDDRRLPHSRRSEQRTGLTGTQVAGNHVHAALLFRANGVHGNPNRLGPDFVHVLIKMFGHIGLVQDDDRVGAALVGQEQIALQAARVVVAVETHHEEDGVDVGGDDLFLGQLARDRRE